MLPDWIKKMRTAEELQERQRRKIDKLLSGQKKLTEHEIIKSIKGERKNDK